MAMTGGTAKLVHTGYANGNSSYPIKLYVYYKSEQDHDKNQSKIICGMYVTSPSSSYDIGAWTDFNGSYVGTTSNTFNGDIPNFAGTYWLVEDKSFVVNHSSNGTGSATIYWKWGVNSPWGKVQNPSGSFSITLPTIPRASVPKSLSCSTSYFNGTLTYKYTPQSNSYYNQCHISLHINDKYVDIRSIPIGKKSASQQTLTVTLSSDELTKIYKNLPTTTSGGLLFTLRTFSDSGYSKQVGDAGYKEVSLTIPTDIKPSIGDITLNPINITTVDGVSRNVLVQDKNTISFAVDGCKAGTGSEIKNYKFEVLSGSTIIATKSTTSASATFGPFSKTGSLKFRLTVTDNRDRSISNKDKEPTWDCHTYEAPTFSSFTAYRCNSSGSADNNGTYVKYSLGVDYSSVNSTNKSTVKIYYKKNTSNTWTVCSNALTDSTTKSAAAVVKNTSGTSITFDLSSTYSVYAVVIDNYNGTVDSSVITIFSSERIFNIRSSKKGIAFGKMAESDNLFESKWPMKVDDEITFGNGIQGSLYTSQNSEGVNIVYLLTGQDTSVGAGAGVALHNTSLYVPSASNSGIVNLGSSGRKWNQLYASNGTISTSDRSVKTDIENMSNTQEKLFNELKPVTYKFIDGTSNRTHYGFISQDIEESLDVLGLDGSDFAGFCKDMQVDEEGVEILDENGKNIYDYSLRYSEFIALNTYMIQKLQAEIAELKATIEELKSTTQN